MTQDLKTNFNYQGTDYNCPIMQLSPTTFVRGFGACEDSTAVWAESCVPEEVGEAGWPMPSADVANKYWERGTHSSCHCEEPKVQGDGCYVGKTFPGFAYF